MTSPSVWYPLLACLLACSAIMAGVWIWARRIGNAGVVDIFWSYNFPVIAILLFFLSPGYGPRKLLVCSMVLLAGLRLGSYLLIRVTAQLGEEEGRYRQLRKDWAPHPDRKFFWFFQMQAVSNVFLSIPFFVITMNREPALSVLEYAGAGLWLLAMLGESLADLQLAAFKKNPAHKGKVCDRGLWNYSRHPNYFFEWLIWVAYFVFALASPRGWLGVISPLSILYLLLKVTGIPMTEEQSIRSRGEAYIKYQQRTSAFVPWFKRQV
jgi:steroid 5-alpha reductase family enzyme